MAVRPVVPRSGRIRFVTNVGSPYRSRSRHFYGVPGLSSLSGSSNFKDLECSRWRSPTFRKSTLHRSLVISYEVGPVHLAVFSGLYRASPSPKACRSGGRKGEYSLQRVAPPPRTLRGIRESEAVMHCGLWASRALLLRGIAATVAKQRSGLSAASIALGLGSQARGLSGPCGSDRGSRAGKSLPQPRHRRLRKRWHRRRGRV